MIGPVADDSDAVQIDAHAVIAAGNERIGVGPVHLQVRRPAAGEPVRRDTRARRVRAKRRAVGPGEIDLGLDARLGRSARQVHAREVFPLHPAARAERGEAPERSRPDVGRGIDLVHPPKVGGVRREGAGVEGESPLTAFERPAGAREDRCFVGAEVHFVYDGVQAGRPAQIGVGIDPPGSIVRPGVVRRQRGHRETPYVPGVHGRQISLDLIHAPKVRDPGRQAGRVPDYRSWSTAAHQVCLRQLGRRAHIDVVQDRRDARFPLEELSRDALRAVGGLGTPGLHARRGTESEKLRDLRG